MNRALNFTPIIDVRKTAVESHAKGGPESSETLLCVIVHRRDAALGINLSTLI